MTLRSTFRELYATAAARAAGDTPGEAYRVLGKGATIRVRVLGRQRQVILGRQRVPVSEAEITTFRRDGDIPPDATRRDWPRTPAGWCFVELRWEAPAQLWEMPQAELPPGL